VTQLQRLVLGNLSEHVKNLLALFEVLGFLVTEHFADFLDLSDLIVFLLGRLIGGIIRAFVLLRAGFEEIKDVSVVVHLLDSLFWDFSSI
jgi:hypothetical protein